MKYTEILFQQKVGQDKETLTYSIPKGLSVKKGQLIKVPLKNQTKTGLIWKIHNKKPEFKTLPIKEIVEKKPLLTEKQLELMEWMSTYYFCPLYKTSKLFIPKRIFAAKPIRKSKIKDSDQIIRTKSKKLTKEQEQAIKTILESKLKNFLIHGITGSGKTEIYTKLTNHYIKKDKQVLILVPEISLTPQIIEYFQKTLDIKAAVIHSKLSEGERYTAWENIHNKKAKLIIGSRSAIFAPFQNLALIIMDEEHEFSYKQDQSPRYSTHKIIEKYQELNPSIKAVFGSATPSVETAEKLKDATIEIKERIGNSTLPKIEIVDLREEFKKQNYSIFSDSLRNALQETLDNKEQAILFLNRRGSASSVVCRDCGYKVECKNCEIPMTFHSKTLGKPTLICHHCGELSEPPTKCPVCKGLNIRFLGIGTQRIETDLLKEFPTARVLRADRDTTSTKHGFKEIYEKFRNHEADILVGTQMIAKGLDLPKVNLVGVILADIGLNIPDFRSFERNFQLMTQVAGRAGRASQKGKVIIQTYTPENLALNYTQTHDYKNFFKYERTQRSLMAYPPFSKLTHAQRRLVQELGREPLLEELAAEMDIDVKKVRHIMKISQDIVSLEAPVGTEEDSKLGDFIEDDEAISPSESTNRQLIKENIHEMLQYLSPRERKIIEMRFGLKDGIGHTLEEVGREFHVTRERIRQIEAKVLQKLKEHPTSIKIRPT